MNGSRCQQAERERFVKFWNTLGYSDLLSFFEAFDADSDRHNAFKTGRGFTHTPTKKDYLKCKPLRQFLGVLGSKKDRAKFVTPTVDKKGFYAVRSCTTNVAQYISLHRETEFEHVFGFIVYMNSGGEYIEALGHVWLRLKNNVDEWIDPTPLESNEHEPKRLLISCSKYLNPRERKLIINNPGGQHLPSMLNTNSRVLAGCKFTDPMFLGYGIPPDYTPEKLRLLCHPVNNDPLPFATQNKIAKLRKDKEFWKFRNEVLRKGGVNV